MMEWIKCTDKMPEQEVDVLCFDCNRADSYELFVACWYYRFGRAYWAGPSDWDRYDLIVTHWMPLPKLPQCDKRDF